VRKRPVHLEPAEIVRDRREGEEDRPSQDRALGTVGPRRPSNGFRASSPNRSISA
jgi:hypothetical protein